MQTFDMALAANVPIDVPSMNTWYCEDGPSPNARNDGVVDELAVLSEPIWRFVRQVPSSRTTRLVVHAPDDPAIAAATTAARQRTRSTRRIMNPPWTAAMQRDDHTASGHQG